MVMDGADLEEVHEQLLAEGDSLMKAMNQYVKTFISDNYENVLGPNVFIMLCRLFAISYYDSTNR